MQKYVPPWANRKEGALPDYVVNQLKDEKHRSLIETLSQTMSSAIRTDESSWAHSTGSGTKPPAWHVNIHGAPPEPEQPSVEEALQTSSAPPKKPKSRITRKEMQERWARKLRFGGPDAKKGELRSLQAIREEFEKHGARNLNKFELDQLLKDHGGKTPQEVKGQGHRPKDSDPTDERDPWFLAHQPEYHYDITTKRWVSKEQQKRERLQGLKKSKVKKKVTFAEPKKKKGSEKADALIVQRHEEQIKKAQKKKKQLKKITDRDEHITGGMEEYHSRNEHDPKDPWFTADTGTVWSTALNRWVDPAKFQAKHVPPVHVAPAVKPKRILPVPQHEQQHLAPSDVQYAESHPDFVPIPRLSWDEDAVAKMEGRPVPSSHAGVQTPPHEPDPAPPVAIKAK